jgi:hypothetical protein
MNRPEARRHVGPKRNAIWALISLALIGLIANACSGETVVDAEQGLTEVQIVETPDPVDAVISDGTAALLDAISEQHMVTINVALTDDGYDPPWIFVPEGELVQLVLRNRGSSEIHYKVEGMVPSELLWINVAQDEIEVGVTDDEHESHHSSEFVRWRATSTSGIKPTGEQVHAYVSRGGDRDVVRFIAPKIGTYSVIDPLHPEFNGEITVY